MQRLVVAVLDRLGTDPGVMTRYLITSGINVVNHQVLLQLAVRWWGWPGGTANVFAAMIAVIPAYLLSRYWVWEVSGPNSVRREVGPFWAIAAMGLITSTTLAEAADRLFEAPILISVASLIGYFVVWIMKFVVLNVVFQRDQAEAPVA
ncbi:MAG: GtrA family protein [Actinomycetota bacterium]